jgi:hypothetical protein
MKCSKDEMLLSLTYITGCAIHAVKNISANSVQQQLANLTAEDLRAQPEKKEFEM